MTYKVYKERDAETYRFQQLIGELRIHPFLVWVYGIVAGLALAAFMMWLAGGL